MKHLQDESDRENPGRENEGRRTPDAPPPEGDRSARPNVVRLERRSPEELRRMIRWTVDFHRPKIERG